MREIINSLIMAVFLYICFAVCEVSIKYFEWSLFGRYFYFFLLLLLAASLIKPKGKILG